MRLIVVTVAGFAALAAPAWPAGEPARAKLTVEHYLDWEEVRDPQISPNGSRVAFVRRTVDRTEDRWDSGIWLVNADGSGERFLVEGSSPRWSPDGTRIAYLAEAEGKKTQIFVRWLDGAPGPTQVTRVAESPSSLRWSPDGRWISFSMLVPKEEEWEIGLPKAPKDAKWTEAPRIVSRLHYRQDEEGFTKTGFTHLFVVPAEGGTPRELTSGDWNAGARFDGLGEGVAHDWSPDGRTIVFDGLEDPNEDYAYQESHIYAVDLASGARRPLTKERGLWTEPVFSPDGKRVAYRGFPHTTRPDRTQELWVMGADGSAPRRLAADHDRSPSKLLWASDGSGVYYTIEDRGAVHLHLATLAGPHRPVTEGRQVWTLGSLSRSGQAAVLRATAHEPPDVYVLDPTRPAEAHRLTRVNDDVLSRVALGEVEELWYESSGGTRVQGWLVKPPDFDPARRHPLILAIHGGPQSMYTTGFNFAFQNFAAEGFLVLYTNPRGSTGYGEAFMDAIGRAYPSVDFDDLMAGVDTVRDRGYVDEKRLFVQGCSGGGVLSSWVIGHTDRFAAAAVRCPVTNWISMAGQTDIPLFTQAFFDKPWWEDPGPWLKQSPLTYVKNVRTPTLLMTGDLDLRTPMSQTEEYFVALKLLRVPVTMVRFAGEYHGTGSKPSNFMRTQLYMISWFGQHVGSPRRTEPTDTSSP